MIRAAYRLKVTLKRTHPPIWRRVLVPEDFTLFQLHVLIQAAMGWRDTHLHVFVERRRGHGARSWMLPDLLEEMDRPDTDGDETTTRVRDLLREPRDGLVYVYDLGDCWVHDILLERLDRAPGDAALPICLKGRGDCPPEDSGGPLVYLSPDTVDDTDDLDDEDLEELEWAAARVIPFDLAAVNRTIAAIDWSDPELPPRE